MQVTQTGSSVQEVTLQNSATAAGNGPSFDIGGFKTLTIEVSGTSTSRTINFEATSLNNVSLPIQGVKLSDMSMSASTTGNNEFWQFDITGLVSFRARIAAVAGGTVSVKGRAVA